MHYGSETFVARMADDSMVPRVCARDFFFVDPDEPAEPGRLVGLRDPESGEVTCRLLVAEDGKRLFRAADPHWPDRVLTRDNETMIAGTVVFVGSGV